MDSNPNFQLYLRTVRDLELLYSLEEWERHTGYFASMIFTILPRDPRNHHICASKKVTFLPKPWLCIGCKIKYTWYISLCILQASPMVSTLYTSNLSKISSKVEYKSFRRLTTSNGVLEPARFVKPTISLHKDHHENRTVADSSCMVTTIIIPKVNCGRLEKLRMCWFAKFQIISDWTWQHTYKLWAV